MYVYIITLKTQSHENKIQSAISSNFLLNLFTMNSQTTMSFANNLNCDVVVGYEMWDVTCNGGQPCSWGSFTLSGGGGTNILSTCTPYDGICVWIMSIDGCSVPNNHASTSGCHILVPFGQSGTLSSSCCNCVTWNAVLTPTGWSIQ